MKLVPVLRAPSSKPCSEIGRGRFIEHIQWSLLVPSDPVEFRASLQQILGRTALTAVAGTPEGFGDHLRIWSGSFGENSLDSVQQPEGGSFTQPGACPSLDESPGCCPIAESTGVGQRATATNRTVGEVPWPVSCRVQQCPVGALIADPCFSEPWVGSEQPLQLREVASLYRRRGCDRTRIVGGYDG